MATVSETGVAPRDLTGYKTLLETRFRDQFDSTLSLEPETPAGQIISVAALMLAEADEGLVELANAFSVSHAADSQIDDLASLLHIIRDGATKSTITATLGGVAGTVVVAGSRASTLAGEEYEILEDATIAADGNIDADMRAVEYGPVLTASGQLTRNRYAGIRLGDSNKRRCVSFPA